MMVYDDDENKKEEKEVEINFIKNDVYSLGITILEMFNMNIKAISKEKKKMVPLAPNLHD